MDRLQPLYTNYNPNTDRKAMDFTAKADPLGQFQSGRVGGLAKTAAKMALAYFTGGAGGSLGASAAGSLGAGAAGQAVGSALGSAAGRSLGSGQGLQGMKSGLLGIGLEGVGGALAGESMGDVGSGMLDSYMSQNTMPAGAGPWDGFNKLGNMVTDPVGNWENIANQASGGKYGQVRGLIDSAQEGGLMGIANNLTGGLAGGVDNYINRAGSSSLNAASSMGGPTAGGGVGIMDAKTLNGMGGGIGTTAGSDIAPGDVGPTLDGPVTGLDSSGIGQKAPIGTMGPAKEHVAGLIDGLDGGVGKGLLGQSVYDDGGFIPINPNETSGVQNIYGQRRLPQQPQSGGWSNPFPNQFR